MSKLRAVSPKKAEPSKPKVLIYGKPGVGKTWGALDFPSCYYIDTEGGADLGHYTEKLQNSGGMYLGTDQGSLDFKTVIEQIAALATEKHEFKTVVIDSISKLFNLAIAKEAERLENEGVKNEFGRDKKPAIAFMRRLISWLQRIDMNVILIAHEKAEWKNGEQVGDTFDAWDRLEYELHLCLNIVKIGPNRLYKVRKSRLTGFPDAATAPWSYESFAEAYGKDIIEKDVTQLILASQKQIAVLEGLVNSVKLPDGWLAKCLNQAGAETVRELSSDQIDKTINCIKTKYLNVIDFKPNN